MQSYSSTSPLAIKSLDRLAHGLNTRYIISPEFTSEEHRVWLDLRDQEAGLRPGKLPDFVRMAQRHNAQANGKTIHYKWPLNMSQQYDRMERQKVRKALLEEHKDTLAALTGLQAAARRGADVLDEGVNRPITSHAKRPRADGDDTDSNVDSDDDSPEQGTSGRRKRTRVEHPAIVNPGVQYQHSKTQAGPPERPAALRAMNDYYKQTNYHQRRCMPHCILAEEKWLAGNEKWATELWEGGKTCSGRGSHSRCTVVTASMTLDKSYVKRFAPAKNKQR